MNDTQQNAAEKTDEAEELVEIEVEADDEAEGQPEAEGAKAEADPAAEPGAGDGKDADDDDDDDEEEDERLSAEERSEKRTRARRRSERRRYAVAQLHAKTQELELRAARAELAAKRNELTIAAFQAQQQSAEIDRQAAAMQAEYQRWQRAKADAINKQDGSRATQADYQLAQIQQRYAQLNEQKLRASQNLQGIGQQAQELEGYEQQIASAYSRGGQVEAQAAPEAPVVGPEGQKLAKSFMDSIPWYRPGTKAGDSAIVDTIDVVLMRDGFNPNTPEYWDEFRLRLKAALPEKFKAPKNPSPPVGGGRDTLSAAKTKMRIPREAMETMRQAGIIDEYNKVVDPKRFNGYVARYKANIQSAKRAS